jgi:hypothetical protein
MLTMSEDEHQQHHQHHHLPDHAVEEPMILEEPTTAAPTHSADVDFLDHDPSAKEKLEVRMEYEMECWSSIPCVEFVGHLGVGFHSL